MAMPARPPRRSTSAAVASSSRLMQSHRRLLSPNGTSSARCAMANAGVVPMPVSPPSSRIVFSWSTASSATVVQRWPSRGTYWRGSVQTGQDGGGASASANWMPQVTHMNRGTRSASGAQARLVRALAGLVLLERLPRVHVAERRMRRHQRLGQRDAEPLREHGRERVHLHLAEARQRLQPRPQLLRGAGLVPDARGVAVVALRHVGGEVADALGHRAREAMHGRPLAERGLEVLRGERGGVEGADALAQHERALERLLDRDLLVEREADEQGER